MSFSSHGYKLTCGIVNLCKNNIFLSSKIVIIYRVGFMLIL